ncbi:amidoligase family protein [Roseicyclus elongatus]|nr:amidoligase family protein [Roseibacterium elongatum]
MNTPDWPTARGADGQPRRLGVELEFGGLTEDAAAHIIQSVAGGTLGENAHNVWRIDTPDLGRCEVYLDTRFREDVARAAGEGAVDLARLVVPVELVTAPFEPAHLPVLNAVVDALRGAGATGSRQGWLLGFGVHLNVEIAEATPGHLWRIVTAYALLEAELRRSSGIDLSRRVLPFVQPYPDVLIDDLADSEPDSLSALIETYLRHAPTRNHGLDLLPIFAHLAPDAVAGRLTDGTETKPRPAYHFRMPDCRIDEAGWSIFEPWSMWLAVERLAASPELFERLRKDRAEWSGQPALQRGRWSTRVRRLLDAPATEDAR